MYKTGIARRVLAGLAVAISAVMLVPGLAIELPAVQAEELPTSGKIGDNVTWTLEDWTLTIKGNGAIWDYAGYNVSNPNYLTRGQAPFRYDTRVRSIVVEPGITRLGDNIFSACTKVTSISIPNTVTSYGEGVFDGCNSLENLTMPNNLTSVPKEMFSACWALKELPDLSKITSIGDYAFSNCGATSINVPASCTSIGDGAFSGCKMESITLPAGMKKIGYKMFDGCQKLKSITIPDGVTEIEPAAFFQCLALKSVKLPGSLQIIGQVAFWGCESLEEVTVPSGAILEDQVFSGCKSLKTATIFGNATEIREFTFASCTSLETVTIPASVTKIKGHAFSDCLNLKTVYVNGASKSASDYSVDGGNESFINAQFKSTNVADPTPAPTPAPAPSPTPSPAPVYGGDPFAEDFAPPMIEEQVVYPNSTVDPSSLDCKFYHQDGKSYWYEGGVRQGTLDDPKGVFGFGTNRGREICDMETAAWYWCDSVYNGAKACNKEVWMPYIYQQEKSWDEAEIKANAAASGNMSAQVERDIKAGTGKWVRYNANGKMFKGWYKVTGTETQIYPNQVGNIYYYDPKTGLMAKGDLEINGVTYHFDEISGVLQR